MNRVNQQVKSQFELGWISAMMDGEGWIILAKRLLPSHNYRYNPICGISSIDKCLINEFARILKVWNVGCLIRPRHFKNPRHNPQWVLWVSGFKRVNKFLTIIEKHLILKGKQAHLVQDYIVYRQSLPPLSACGDKEENFQVNLKKLNSNRQNLND